MAKTKQQLNVFKNAGTLKAWALDLSDACGSIIANKAPSIEKIDNLVEKFVIDYNENMEKANASKKETS